MDYETDSDPDDILVINSNRRSFIRLFVQENADDTNVSDASGQKSKDSELWPLTTVNNPPQSAIDEGEETEFNDPEKKSNENKINRKKKRKK